MRKIFAWVQSPKGPIPVIYHDGLPFNSTTGKPDSIMIMQHHNLKDGEEMLTIDQLKVLYPYKDLEE